LKKFYLEVFYFLWLSVIIYFFCFLLAGPVLAVLVRLA
jgi:hypothetical protein